MQSPTELAFLLSDWEFETLIRTRVRAQLTKLETITNGHSSPNLITFILAGERAEWTVTYGKTYSTTHTSRGEVLTPLIDAALVHASMLEQSKMNLLAKPQLQDDDLNIPEPPNDLVKLDNEEDNIG